MKAYIKRVFQDIAIFSLVFLGIRNLYISLPLRPMHGVRIKINADVLRAYASIHYALPIVTGLLMLLVVYWLYKRVRTAWIIEITVLSIGLILQLFGFRHFFWPLFLWELAVWVILLLSYHDFSRRPATITLKKAVGFIAVSVLLLFTNAAIGLYLMRGHILHIKTIFDAFASSFNLLVFMNSNVLSFSSRVGYLYADSLIIANWVCIVSSVLLLLKPLIYNPVISHHDKTKARELVMRHGQNPIAYLALEEDKKYLFGRSVEGVCAYRVVRNVFTVCGDLICAKADGFAFLNEIVQFCHHNDYTILFMNITDFFTDLLTMAGFGITKYGEDACFKLEDYNLSGGKSAKVRAAINHAIKCGICVQEYLPLVTKSSQIERQMQEISHEWLQQKGGTEMGFMVGGTGLDNPLDRRYFYATDPEGSLLGFVVFLPYLSGDGYFADITRRRSDAPQGVLEKIIFDAFMQMKAEGSHWGNLGLSPLYNVNKDEICTKGDGKEGKKTTITTNLFTYIYENMEHGYNFKALHHAKKKYGPTQWQPRYISYSPNAFTPNFAYAVVKVQFGKGLSGIVKEFLLSKQNENQE